MTYQEACETISRSNILEKDGKNPTAEEILNYSPSGELFMIHEWYPLAKQALEKNDSI